MRKTVTLVLVATLCLAFTVAPAAAKSYKARSAWLGVFTQTVDKDIADAFELDIDYGAIVNEVIDDSPAEEAGIEDGDVIIKFGGQKVWDQDDLVDFIEENSPGDRVPVELMRDGKKVSVEVELGKRPRSSTVWSGTGSKKRGPRVFSAPDDAWVLTWNQGGYIGVQLTDLSEQLGDYFGVKGDKGVLVSEVKKDSPAEKAGLRAGDVITAIDDEEVKKFEDVKEIVSESDEGDKLTLTIIRNKKEQQVDVEVGEYEDDENSFGYRFYNFPPDVPGIRNMPDVDIVMPKVRGRYNRQYFDKYDYFDFDEFQEDMSKFKEEMEKFKEEMKDLDWKLKRLEKEDRRELKDELDKLRQELEELEERIR